MIEAATTLERDEAAGLRDAFRHVDTWVFKLDDTLYPRSVGLHRQLKQRVVRFVADHLAIDQAAAEALHLDYYERYGATLQGMVERHGVAPQAFLDFVHAIDLSALQRDDDLIAALEGLPGRRIVFTNASRGHAAAALDAMGLAKAFDAIASIEDSDFVGKPHRSAFSGFLAAHGVDPGAAAMFEDRGGNLLVPHELGMKTVLVVDPLLDPSGTVAKPRHVDAVVTNLAAFLRDIAGRV
ncbi:MAG: pyrimidine 5'-nucleotidase [Xanthobacteraceae bacterium]|nr:pyrimidine 5'-nucleotidase [Xanthobacteraceae bacterium]